MGQTSRFEKRNPMIWICPTRINRPHGALPRLRGQRGRRPFGVPRTCRARAKRGGAPRGPQAGFSLVEVLASLFILTLSAVGITAAWRLADYQELLTRADRRAERILRQYYELQTFAPADSRPFTANAS